MIRIKILQKKKYDLDKTFNDVNYIVLNRVSLNKTKYKDKLHKYKKIIMILICFIKKFYKSIVVTGTNGKSQLVNY